MFRRIIFLAISILVMFILVFLFYYRDGGFSDGRLGDALIMAAVITFIPVITIALGAFFGSVTYLPATEQDRVNKVLSYMDLEIMKEKEGKVKYKIRDKRWPFNVLRVRQNKFNIYLVSNYYVIKQIKEELQGEV